MALSSVIGALRVVLGADTAALDAGMAKAKANVSSFGKDITKIAAGIGLERVLESAVAGLVGGIKQAFTAIDELGKTSQKIGVPIEELSKMQHAADLSGVSLESLSKGMGKLSQAMFNSTKSGTDPAAEAFKRLGVSAVDSAGNLRAPSDVMVDLADKFAAMKDGAAKTALSMALIGKAGKDWIPLLNAGRAGLAEMAKEAQDFGLVISQRTFVATELFNDNMTRLGKISQGVANVFVREVAPVLALLTGRMVEAARESGFVEEAGKKLAKAFINTGYYAALLAIHIKRVDEEITLSAQLVVAFAKDITDILAPAIIWVRDKFDELVQKINDLPGAKVIANIIAIEQAIRQFGYEVLKAKLFGEDLGESVDETGQEAEEATPKFARTSAVLTLLSQAGQAARTSSENLAEAFRQAMVDAEKLIDGLVRTNNGLNNNSKGAVGAANAVDQFLKSQVKSIAGMRAEAETVGMVAGARESLKLKLEAEAIAAENHLTMTQAQINKLNELRAAAAGAALELKGRQLVEEALPAWEAYQKKLEEARLAMIQIGADAATTGRVLQDIAVKAGATWDLVMGGVVGNFATLFKELGKQGGKWAEFAKALAIFEAIINTYTAFTKALSAPPGPPISYAIAAGVLAAGLAKVAAIKSQKEPKMALGGAMRMSNFASGPDSQLLTARIRPDEQVDIWRPGEGGADPRGRAGGAVQEIVIRVDEISRATVEKLIPALNKALGDGHRLKMGTV